MILDSQMMMSDKQALAANTQSTNVIDLPRLPPGHDLGMVLDIRVHSVSGTNPTLQAVLETSTDNSTFTPVLTLPKPVGKNRMTVELEGQRLNRYLRMSYILGGTTPLFNVSAMLVAGEDDWSARADSPRQS